MPSCPGLPENKIRILNPFTAVVCESLRSQQQRWLIKKQGMRSLQMLSALEQVMTRLKVKSARNRELPGLVNELRTGELEAMAQSKVR
jgi:hypothetical protein